MRNAGVEHKLLKALSDGLPVRAACGLAGISEQALRSWRADDPEFNQKIELAEARAVEADMAVIREARSGDWRASSWRLERKWPAEFGSPQVQLNIQNNLQQNSHLGLTATETAELFRINKPMIDALLNGTLLIPPDDQVSKS
jgi:hypothetical protein